MFIGKDNPYGQQPDANLDNNPLYGEFDPKSIGNNAGKLAQGNIQNEGEKLKEKRSILGGHRQRS